MTISRGDLRFNLNLPGGFRLHTERLTLVPSTSELANTSWQDRERLSELLGARVPESWPPQLVAPADASGWFDWYVVLPEGETPVVAGCTGIKLLEEDGRSVQIGCSFVPEYQQQGYGTESVAALTNWLLAKPEFPKVVAEAPEANTGSIRILNKLGFAETSRTAGTLMRFEKTL